VFHLHKKKAALYVGLQHKKKNLTPEKQYKLNVAHYTKAWLMITELQRLQQ
jgi:hypothetical protein